jgi:uncharacterized protein (DUF58 family)
VREALRGLTLRGRAFTGAGLTALVCAVAMDLPSLSSVGVLLLGLPLGSAALAARSRYRLSLVRTVTPQIVSAGQQATVTLQLANQGRAPGGVLLLEDRLPYVLGSRPRIVIDGMSVGWQRQATYPVRSEVRGRFEIGPMTIRVIDPFGMVELGRTFHTTVPLTVTPRTVPLPALNLGGSLTGSGDNRPRAFATGGAEDVTVREYRRGDDLRRVHWRSSARHGELMVRREEQPWQSRATLLVDNRSGSHRGQGAASSLEGAVSVAASIAVHLSRRGYAVRLVTAASQTEGGATGGGAWHTRDVDSSTAPLLEELAVLEESPATNLDLSWLADQSGGGLVVAVLGAVADHDGPVLRRMLSHSGGGLAVALDVEAWCATPRPDPSQPGGGAAPLLRRMGWRAVRLGPRDSLESAWQDLARGPAQRSATPAPHPGAEPAVDSQVGA